MSPRRHILLSVFKLVDKLIMLGSFGFATWITVFGTNGTSLKKFLELRLKLSNVLLLLLLLLLWEFIFRWFGMYRSRRLDSEASELLDVLKAVSVGTLAVWNAGILFQIQIITPPFVYAFWLTSGVATAASRLLLRHLLSRIRAHGRNLNFLVIVGTNPRARRLADRLRARPDLGYRIVGYFDNDWDGMQEFHASGEKLLGSIDDLKEFLRQNVVDEVLMALPLSSCYRQADGIVALCEEQGVTVLFLSDLFNLTLARANIESFEGDPLIRLKTGRLEGTAVLAKRALDFTLSALLLVGSAPVLAVVALLIKLSSPGPVFFVQERIGLNKRRFRLIKFRTMVADADQRLAEIEHLNEATGPVFKIEKDPRLTPIGRFLRKTSIDELPQLINVLIGDMSLVGPRPLPVRDYAGFDEDWHRRRFSVRPGITCLWQVSGRSALPFERWMELDMLYIDEWSLWLDLAILARTVPAVLRGSGAA